MTTTDPSRVAPLRDAASPSEFLTFLLRDEEYGVDILTVREIRGWDGVTEIPNMPEYVRGVINLRGSVVPLVDLRVRFGLDSIDYGPTTVVIVLGVEDGGREKTFGIVVDAVSEVCVVSEEQINPAPDLGSCSMSSLRGIAALEDKMVILLNVARIVCDDALEAALETEDGA